MKKQIAILWSAALGRGGLEVDHGTICGASSFDRSDTHGRLEIEVDADSFSFGKFPAIARFCSDRVAFSFFVRDVNSSWPILIPGYEVAVTTADDPRSYVEILGAVEHNGLKTVLEGLEEEPEESFNAAARHTRVQQSQVWMDMIAVPRS